MECGTVIESDADRLAGVGAAADWPGLARREERSREPLTFALSAPPDRVELARAAGEARTALREAAIAAVEAAARARTLADELNEMLAALPAPEAAPRARPRPGMPFGGHAHLSPREREVLALVAEGHTNKAIAEALYVSPNTVKTHVASLLAKLDADTRVQLATIAVQHP